MFLLGEFDYLSVQRQQMLKNQEIQERLAAIIRTLGEMVKTVERLNSRSATLAKSISLSEAPQQPSDESRDPAASDASESSTTSTSSSSSSSASSPNDEKPNEEPAVLSWSERVCALQESFAKSGWFWASPEEREQKPEQEEKDKDRDQSIEEMKGKLWKEVERQMDWRQIRTEIEEEMSSEGEEDS